MIRTFLLLALLVGAAPSAEATVVVDPGYGHTYTLPPILSIPAAPILEVLNSYIPIQYNHRLDEVPGDLYVVEIFEKIGGTLADPLVTSQGFITSCEKTTYERAADTEDCIVDLFEVGRFYEVAAYWVKDPGLQTEELILVDVGWVTWPHNSPDVQPDGLPGEATPINVNDLSWELMRFGEWVCDGIVLVESEEDCP